MERLWYHGELRQFGKRLDARHDGDGDAHLACAGHEVEIFLVVEKQLRHRILRAQLLLLQQMLHVHLQVRSLFVFLRIAGHSIAEGLTWVCDGRPVSEESLVEAVHLLDEVGCVAMPTACGFERSVVLCLVAAQQQHIADAQKLQVEQLVFYIFNGHPAANHMRYHRNAVSLLNGSGYGHGTRAAAYALPFELPVFQLLVDIFAVVRRNVDIKWCKFLQLVDGGKQAVGACAFQWR